MFKQGILLCLCFVMCLTETTDKNSVYCTDKYLNKCFENAANLIIQQEQQKKKDKLVRTGIDIEISTPIANLKLFRVAGYGLYEIHISNASIDLENNRMEYIYSADLFTWRQNYTAKFLVDGEYETNEGTGDILFHKGKYLASFEFSPTTNKIQNASAVWKVWSLDFSKLGDIESNPKYKKGIEDIKKNFLTSEVKVMCGNALAPLTQAALEQCVL